MQEKYKKLREPLKNEDIELRVGRVGAKGATLLLYKTARVDTKRLDEIFGGRWQRTHYVDNKGNVVCKISIFDEELKEWITREDVGTESNTEKEKGAYSDAFKRAGFAWGIGVELYNSPFIHIACETVGKGEADKFGNYKSYELKDRYYFNDVLVSKFEVINDNVFVEISKKSQSIYSNFKDNTLKEPVKQEMQQKPVQEKKLTEAEYAKLEDGIKNCQTVGDLIKYATTTLTNNKPNMSQTQYSTLKTMLDGYKNTLIKAEVDKINAKKN